MNTRRDFLKWAGAGAAWLARPGGAGVGRDGENLSLLEDGNITVGAGLDRGGAITFLRHAADGRNLVNDHDCGRQIQQSYYSGPHPFDPEKNMHPGWQNWCWNPIQVGDAYGNRVRVVEHHNDGRQIYVKTIPLHWALNNVPAECAFETWIRLQDGVVKVRCRLNNNRSDTTQYPAHGQELPAVYTVGTLHRLYTYAGIEPFTGGEPERIENAGPPWAGWRATENWAALVDDKGWGVGVFHPRVVRFTGGFHGQPGRGGPTDNSTGYISPLYKDVLDHNIRYEYRYTLIPGSLDEIRRWVYDHRPDARPHYVFRSDRQHWHYRNAGDTGWPVDGALRVKLEGRRPQMIGPLCAFRAADVPRLYVRAAYHLSDPAPAQLRARLSWRAQQTDNRRAGEAEQADSAEFRVVNSEWRTYEVNLSSVSGWRGLIGQLRFDPVPYGRGRDYVELAGISYDANSLVGKT